MASYQHGWLDARRHMDGSLQDAGELIDDALDALCSDETWPGRGACTRRSHSRAGVHPHENR